MIQAFFPGSFDPPTNGHVNIVERALKMCDVLHIAISQNAQKKPLFTGDERVSLVTDIFKYEPKIKVHLCKGLVTDLAVELNADLIIRGVRLTDFSYEFELSMIYRHLLPDIEVIFMPADPKSMVIRSSVIKELMGLGGDFRDLVPEQVFAALNSKL